MLVTVLGELVEPVGDPVWTAALLHVLTGMGFEDRAARQAIDRAGDAGWIEPTRFGRNVRWQLTPAGQKLIARGTERVQSLSTPPPQWDGDWLVLMVTLPGNRRAVRKRLYAALSWEGFGNPTPGVWLSPHTDRLADASAIIDELDLHDTTLAFVGPSARIGLDDATIVERAWDLAEVAASYEQLLSDFSERRPTSGDGLLFSHLALVNEWQRFPFLDPQLPDELLGNWIGNRAATLFEQRRAEWTFAARARWQEVVAAAEPALGQEGNRV